ncbi:MAG: hypothetical protein B7X04_04495, partial [Parcubacteria group bacterium 21-54-25]
MTSVTENSGTSALTISGPITVNAAGTTLTNANASGSSLLTVSGGTTGAGNLILDNNSAIADGITISGASVNNTGTVTNSGTGTGSTLISAVIGANVTGVTQNSATSALTLSGTNTYTGGTTISAGTLHIPGSIAVSTAGNLGNTAAAVTITGGGILDYTGAGGSFGLPVNTTSGIGEVTN